MLQERFMFNTLSHKRCSDLMDSIETDTDLIKGFPINVTIVNRVAMFSQLIDYLLTILIINLSFCVCF